jgi:hypothetical protein
MMERDYGYFVKLFLHNQRRELASPEFSSIFLNLKF